MQALSRGMRVAGYTLEGASTELVDAGLLEAATLDELVATLGPRRAILLYIPAGSGVDEVIEQLADAMDPGDVIVDGGNSYWGDSIRRAERLGKRGLHFVDAGTSGGVDGARHGACFMLGGEQAAIERVESLFRALAIPGGYVHAGPPGAGHFTKLVHNGIEFGMLQAIGEGVALLQAYPDQLPVADVLRCWRHGSVIRSWLVDLMEEGYRAHGGLGDVPSHVDDTGEVNWLIGDALRLEVPVPVIAQATMQLLVSRDQHMPWARAIAVMRHGFGGHPLGSSPAIAHERHVSRVGSM